MRARRHSPRAAALTAAALAFTASSVVAQAPFSVQDVMSYSFASGLVAASDADRIAWVENREGARNIWVAEGPSWDGRQITDYPDDDGQELGSLAFGPGGNRIYFVRGGAPNRQGEVPDPRSTADVEGRAVWAIPFGGGNPVHIVDAGGFTLSPTGNGLVFSRGREIFLVGAAGGDESRLARIRGSAGSLTFSPDGSRLAFVSGRGDHAFIGIYEMGGGSVRYLDPSVGNDGNPVWSPDGSEIAFTRVPNERVVHMFSPRREALPFSIRIADIATGEGREVWKAREGVGSAFSGVNASNQLYWLENDQIVFPWEGDGWKRLYSVPAGGGTATPVAPAGGEVQFASAGPDGRTIVFDSNSGDIDRKNLWRATPGDGSARQLTSGTMIEWGAVMTGSGSIAFNASTGRDPAHTRVLDGADSHRVGPDTPSTFPTAAMVEPEQVIFRSADGMQIHGQLFRPPGAREGTRYPGVLFFHGGSRRQMLLGFHHRGYYHNAYALNQLLANAGYVVLSVNFRSGIGYGMEFREALNYGATGASEFNDVMGAGLYMQSRDDVDPNRIGLWGGSYGGYLTALGLARASDLFAAGVDIHGVHDWNVVINGFRPSYEPEDYPEFSQLAYDSSPMAFLDGWRSPVLLIHGDDDRNVPFRETVDLVEALMRRGVEYEQLIFPDEVHGFLLHENWVRAFEASYDFFERKLKGRPIS